MPSSSSVCHRYWCDDDGIGTTVARNGAQVIGHAVMLLLPHANHYGCCPRFWLNRVICYAATGVCCSLFFCFGVPSYSPASSRTKQRFIPFLFSSFFYYILFLLLLQIVWCTGFHVFIFCPRAHALRLALHGQITLLDVCELYIFVSSFVATEVVSTCVQGISTGIACAECGLVERSV